MAKIYKSIQTVSESSDLLRLGDSEKVLTRTLDGYCMSTLNESYLEFAKKLQFPSYFGENMNALYDMLTDLSWLSFEELRLVVERSYLLLIDETSEVKESLFDLLDSAASFWANPIQEGQPWDRGAKVFRTILVE